MFAKKPAPFFFAFLTDFRHAARQWLAFIVAETGILVWLLLLLAMPVLIFSQLPLPDLQGLHVEPQSHLLIEAFCGLAALSIAGMILTVCLKRRDPSMILFGLGFLAMGIFDLLHAWTDPDTQRASFVLYHTLSTLLGSVFILAGVVVRIAADRNHGLSSADLAVVVIGLAIAVGVAALYHYSIPGLFPAGKFGFSPVHHTAHYFAGLFYLLAGIAFYRYLRKQRPMLAFLAFSLLVVFAQSAYLFTLSSMWDLTWWVWHGVKLFFYVASMLIVFVAFLLALRTIEESRHSMDKLQALNLQIKAASTAKSQFLANMSHEFRTPLNAIIGFTEVLQDQIPGPLNADQLEYLGDIHNAGQLLLRLINDVLDLAKVEAGRLELFYESFPIAQTVREAVTALRGAAEKKGLAIQLNLPPDLGLITADQIRLKQILFNLLSNAMKFTDRGGVTVTATIEDGQLHLTIADTGIGIRPEDMQRIFVEFSQVNNSHARRYEGTGLGLALSKRLVEAHGGRIWLESTFGTGSVFHVLLPLQPPNDKNNSPNTVTQGS